MAMNWETLYTSQRTGDKGPKSANPERARTSFVRDYDRIIFSSSFRRLQNKTQVFPLPGAVFVHNRLTHSLEVASIGRSLGKAVGECIANKYPDTSKEFQEFYRHELPYVIASACLAHDIGNPPFGHSGEEAIRNFFLQLEGKNRKQYESLISENKRKDFELFEGNANAFRILTHSFNEEESSYKLTYTTLASIVKYPCASYEGFNKSSGLIATKKSGFFATEQPTYESIALSLGIPRQSEFHTVYARHPFVFLTEAADDICYRVIDLEDAHRLKIIDLKTFENLFLPFFDEETGYNSRDSVVKKLNQIRDDNQKVQFIRAKWIGLMIQHIRNAFMDAETALLEGTLNQDLLSCIPKKEQELIKAINTFSVAHIYNYRTVIEIELAGYNIIGGLLQAFVEAVMYPEQNRSQKLLQLIPAQFPITRNTHMLYENIQSVVDFISGMTDLYAIDLFRKITGMSIPEIR